MNAIVPPLPISAPTLIQQPFPVLKDPAPRRFRFFPQRISAGFPSPAADYIEASLDLNAYLAANRASIFFFRVTGDSMLLAGILDGDFVGVDRSIEARSGHIVIAVVNGEYTIKRLYKRGHVIELRAENPAYPPRRFAETDELQIWGVVTSVVRRFSV